MISIYWIKPSKPGWDNASAIRRYNNIAQSSVNLKVHSTYKNRSPHTGEAETRGCLAFLLEKKSKHFNQLPEYLPFQLIYSSFLWLWPKNVVSEHSELDLWPLKSVHPWVQVDICTKFEESLPRSCWGFFGHENGTDMKPQWPWPLTSKI